MLPSGRRLRTSAQFQLAVRRGRRAGSSTVVVHLLRAESPDPLQAGFVVSKGVGTAVTRNLVKRRLRHLVRERLRSLPASGLLVVRANPAAATAGYAELGSDLDRCLQRVSR